MHAHTFHLTVTPTSSFSITTYIYALEISFFYLNWLKSIQIGTPKIHISYNTHKYCCVTLQECVCIYVWADRNFPNNDIIVTVMLCSVFYCDWTDCAVKMLKCYSISPPWNHLLDLVHCDITYYITSIAQLLKEHNINAFYPNI